MSGGPDVVKAAALSLAAEVVIQTTATLHDLATTPALQITDDAVERLRAVLEAAMVLAGGAHYSRDAGQAFRQAGHNNGRLYVAAEALPKARHSLRILSALYGPQEDR